MSKTLEGLMEAFVGECQARNRYTFYASIAKKEGLQQMSEIFTMTADNEREHASWFYKMIKEVADKEKVDLSTLKTMTPVPFMLGTTEENITASIMGETHEYAEMYPEISAQAMKDGFERIAVRVKAIANSEKHHADRYSKLLENLKNNTVFEKSENVYWVCRECGYLHYGKKPPLECPSCGHDKGFYQVQSEQY